MGSKIVIYPACCVLSGLLMVAGIGAAALANSKNGVDDPGSAGAGFSTEGIQLLADKGDKGDKGKSNKGKSKKKNKNKNKQSRSGGGSGGGKKVTICHVPPGNPANAHTISVGAPAVNAHLGHGDYTGPCRASDPSPQPPVPPTVPLPPAGHDGSILVRKYHDLNQNGWMDEGEPGLNDWQFVVYDVDGNEVATDVTHDNRRSGEPGWLRFELPFGEYSICEVLQEGWINTDPGTEQPCRSVIIDAAKHGGGRGERLSFGNAYDVPHPPQDLVSVHVFKYHDLNRNGVRDPDEPGLNDWEIVIFDAQDQEIASAFTQNHPHTGEPGWALFDDLPATDSDYLVCERLRRGWGNTDPGEAVPCKNSSDTGTGTAIAGGGEDHSSEPVIVVLDDDRASSYRITLVDHYDNTWTYIVEELNGRDLSHWNLGLGECLAHLTDYTPGAETGPDGSTGFHGIKWNVGDGFGSGEFSITLDGAYPPGSIEVLVKAGNGFATAVINGPDCSGSDTDSENQDDSNTIYIGNSRRRY